MSNDVYPDLIGLKFGVTRTPRFKTTIDETASGREYRTALMVYPRTKVTLSYEFLRDRTSADEFRTLLGFFKKRRGSYDSFLLNDPDDNSVTDQQFGVGDGTTTAFQLVRTLGGFVEPVYDLNGVPTIQVNGGAPGSYSISATGLVTFAAAPAVGADLTWSGAYYWRCRFMQDEMEFEKFMQQLWQAGKVEMQVVKP